MWPDQHAIFLAIMLVLAGISQLVSPAIGYVCDRTFTRFGRRLPFILGGNLETTAGCEMTNTFWDVATDAKQKLNPSQLPLPVAAATARRNCHCPLLGTTAC